MNALSALGLRIYALVHLLTYLHSWLWAYKTDNISEKVEYLAKLTVNGLYKIEHRLSIAGKMYDLALLSVQRVPACRLEFLENIFMDD